MTTCTPEPTAAPAGVSVAQAEPQPIGAAIRTSTLSPIVRLVVWTIADLAADLADAGRPLTICLEEVADATGMRPAHVAHAIADLIDHGWLTRTPAGWHLDAPAPRTGP